jgi:hypothetical protein
VDHGKHRVGLFEGGSGQSGRDRGRNLGIRAMGFAASFHSQRKLNMQGFLGLAAAAFVASYLVREFF